MLLGGIAWVTATATMFRHWHQGALPGIAGLYGRYGTCAGGAVSTSERGTSAGRSLERNMAAEVASIASRRHIASNECVDACAALRKSSQARLSVLGLSVPRLVKTGFFHTTNGTMSSLTQTGKHSGKRFR
jgi:hypothetical protein